MLNAYVWHVANWPAVRTGAGVRPALEEVGPFNFTREVCVFDRQLVTGAWQCGRAIAVDVIVIVTHGSSM